MKQELIPQRSKSLFKPLLLSYVSVSLLLLFFDYWQNESLTTASSALLVF
ncbi:MAG: hypothetical protein ACRC17_10740 [Culicoidibacterales bacterium]